MLVDVVSRLYFVYFPSSSMLYKDIFNFLEWSFPNPNFILDAFQIISCSLYLEL